jgi:3',5'-cyclic AMP phosphodiesterase CpdA
VRNSPPASAVLGGMNHVCDRLDFRSNVVEVHVTLECGAASRSENFTAIHDHVVVSSSRVRMFMNMNQPLSDRAQHFGRTDKISAHLFTKKCRNTHSDANYKVTQITTPPTQI